MKTLICTFIALLLNISAYGLPNMKNYEHNIVKLEEKTTYINKKFIDFMRCKIDIGPFWYAYDEQTKVSIIIVDMNENYLKSSCGIMKNDELIEQSTDIIIGEYKNKDIIYYHFDNGRFLFIPSEKIGGFQTWDY